MELIYIFESTSKEKTTMPHYLQKAQIKTDVQKQGGRARGLWTQGYEQERRDQNK